MIGVSGGRRVLLATQPIDFRKGMDTLAALVAEVLKADPFCGDVFVFRPKRCDRLKLLVWDGSGLILATKRLEEGRFCWPPVRNGSLLNLGLVRFARRRTFIIAPDGRIAARFDKVDPASHASAVARTLRALQRT